MNKKDFIGKTFVTDNSKDTQKLGFNFAKVLAKGDAVCLYGDLGSGKTTFVQGLAKGLGVTNRIISPTFMIIRNYRSKNYGSRIMSFYHIDLYRMESTKDIEGLGLEEILNDPENVVIIEWAERLKSLMSKKRIDIKFSYEKGDKRKIGFSLTT